MNKNIKKDEIFWNKTSIGDKRNFRAKVVVGRAKTTS